MVLPSENCAVCDHSDNDHLDMGMCQVYGCKCEEYHWVEQDEEEDMSGSSYIEGTNNER